MTLYRFPSGKLSSDETYKEDFQTEYPKDRPEASPDYIAVSKNEERQITISEDEEEEDE